MKRSLLSNFLVFTLILTLGGVGCKQRSKGLTPIPGQKSAVSDPSKAPFVGAGPAIPGEGGPAGENLTTSTGPEGTISHAGLERFADRPANREVFKDFVVYFDFDRAEIKASERPKIESVASQMRSGPAGNDLAIEGHCDERGTDEYNRALGERRALAIREYLVNLGIAASRIQTISYGEDRPVDPGHSEAAWAKNRRGEFLLLLPK